MISACLAARAPLIAANPVDERLRAEQLRPSFQTLAQTLGHANRREVVGAYETDDSVAPHLLERELKRAPCGLSRVTLTPELATQNPSQLEPWPPLRIEEPDPSHEPPALQLFHGPRPVPAQLPVAQKNRHLPPRHLAREWSAVAQVARHLRVAHNAHVLLEVLPAEHAQYESLGF